MKHNQTNIENKITIEKAFKTIQTTCTKPTKIQYKINTNNQNNTKHKKTINKSLNRHIKTQLNTH